MTELNNIQACFFDANGTLFDVHFSVSRHRERLGFEPNDLLEDLRGLFALEL